MADNSKRYGGTGLTRSKTFADPSSPTKAVRKVAKFGGSLRKVFKRDSSTPPPRNEIISPTRWKYQDLVPAPLNLRRQRSASLYSFSSGSEETLLHWNPSLAYRQTLRSEHPTLSEVEQCQNRALPALPSQPPKQETHPESKVAQFQTSNEDDWEAAVDEAYELGEFAHAAEAGQKWLLEEEQRNPNPVQAQPKVEGILNRGRIIRARPFKDEYYVNRPRNSGRK